MIVDALAPRQWVLAQARAEAENLVAFLERSSPDFQLYQVTSGTVEGLLYTVQAYTTPDIAGKPIHHLDCDCEAGAHRSVCKHVYMAAAMLGWIDPERIREERRTIKGQVQLERQLANLKRAQEKAAAKRERQLERDARRALYPGQTVTVGGRGLGPLLSPYRGRPAVVGAIYPNGTIRLDYGASGGHHAEWLILPAEQVRRLPEGAPDAPS